MKHFKRLTLILVITTALLGQAGAHIPEDSTSTPSPLYKVEVVTPPESPLYKVLPIILSALAFVFSIFNLAVLYFFKPKIKVVLGDHVRMFETHDSRLAFTLDVTLFNKGARYGAVYKMSGNISHATLSPSSKFRWDSFVESKNVGEPGVQFKPFDEFAGWAQTLVVPGRAASAKLIKFLTADEFGMVPGKFVIELFAYEGESLLPSSTTQASFTVSSDDILKFRATKPDMAGSSSKGQLRLPLEANGTIVKSGS